MKVLRERPRELCDLGESQDPQDVMGRQLCSQNGTGQRDKQPEMESADDCLSKKIEALVCNGNGIVGSLLKSQHRQNFPLCFTMSIKTYVDEQKKTTSLL